MFFRSFINFLNYRIRFTLAKILKGYYIEAACIKYNNIVFKQ